MDFKHLTADGLVKAFYNSFEDEESFKGSADTINLAREVVARGDEMWNHPYVIVDAEDYIKENS